MLRIFRDEPPENEKLVNPDESTSRARTCQGPETLLGFDFQYMVALSRSCLEEF
jgi:hypothetical protein